MRRQGDFLRFPPDRASTEDIIEEEAKCLNIGQTKSMGGNHRRHDGLADRPEYHQVGYTLSLILATLASHNRRPYRCQVFHVAAEPKTRLQVVVDQDRLDQVICRCTGHYWGTRHAGRIQHLKRHLMFDIPEHPAVIRADSWS